LNAVPVPLAEAVGLDREVNRDKVARVDHLRADRVKEDRLPVNHRQEVCGMEDRLQVDLMVGVAQVVLAASEVGAADRHLDHRAVVGAPHTSQLAKARKGLTSPRTARRFGQPIPTTVRFP
jgi:hypothetical protein